MNTATKPHTNFGRETMLDIERKAVNNFDCLLAHCEAQVIDINSDQYIHSLITLLNAIDLVKYVDQRGNLTRATIYYSTEVFTVSDGGTDYSWYEFLNLVRERLEAIDSRSIQQNELLEKLS